MATKSKARAKAKAKAKAKTKRTQKASVKTSAKRKTVKKTAKRKTVKKSAKKTAKKTTRRAGSEDALREAAIAAAFARAAEHGWEAVRLDEVALAMGISPLRLRELYGRADDILFDFMARTVASLAAEPPESASVRETLLELLMRLLDAYEPHREGICRVWQDLRRDPRPGLRLAPKAYGSFASTLRLAGAPDSTVYVLGFAAVHLAVLEVWATDADPSRNRTLAAADKYLGWAEKAAGFCD